MSFFFEYLPYPEGHRHAADQDVEVAGEAVLQRGQLEEPLHQLIGVGAALEVDGDLHTAQTRLVADIGYIAYLAVLDEVDDLLDDDLGGGGRRYMGDVDAVLLFVVGVYRADSDRAPARAVDLADSLFVIDDLRAAGEIRSRQGGDDIVILVTDQGGGGLAYLAQVEGAYVARHTYGDTGVGVDQHRREGRRQQGRLLHRVVVVVDEIDGVPVDIPEQLVAYRVELSLGITRGSPRHITRVELTEVALAVYIRMQQSLVAAAQTYHRVVDGAVAVGVELHRSADDVRRLGARAGEQTHLVHGVQQLAVRGLEAVYLGDGSRHDDAHRIGHEVFFDSICDALFHYIARAGYNAV